MPSPRSVPVPRSSTRGDSKQSTTHEITIRAPDDNPEARAPAKSIILDMLEPGDWAHAYFDAYLSTVGRATVGASCKAAGINRSTYTNRLQDDAIFATIHREANALWVETIERELHTRVLDGTSKPVWNRGEIIGYIREVDNKLLCWYLERLAPEKYHLPTMTDTSGGDAPPVFKFDMGEKRELEAGTDEEKS